MLRPTNHYKTSGPEVIKLFSCSTQLSMKFTLLINLKILTFFKTSFMLSMKKVLIVGIFIFMTK